MLDSCFTASSSTFQESKKTDSSFHRKWIARTSSFKGGTSGSTPLSTVKFCLTWACLRSYISTIVSSYVQLPYYAQNTQFQCISGLQIFHSSSAVMLELWVKGLYYRFAFRTENPTVLFFVPSPVVRALFWSSSTERKYLLKRVERHIHLWG